MSKFLRWIPALFLMVIIFLFSSTPSTNLPNYGFWDTVIKKGGHMMGYGLLSITYWYGFSYVPQKSWLAWLMALLYAVSDECHQSFTPGRSPSVADIFIYDGGGAAIGLAITAAWVWMYKQKHEEKSRP